MTHNSGHQQAAACVFDCRYSKAIAALLMEDCVTTHQDRKAAMLAKQPPMSVQDDAII